MALGVYTDVSVAINTRTLSWSPTYVIGDVVVVCGMTWDPGDAQLNTPAGTGLTFAQRVVRTTAAKVYQSIWTAVASAGSSGAVTCSQTTATGNIHSGLLYVCPAADGYSLAATPNSLSGVASGASAPQGSLAGASGSLGIGIIGDWSGTALGAPRSYVGTATEDAYNQSTGDSTQLYWHQDLTGPSTTVGLTAPTTSSSWDIAAIEVLKSAGGPAAASLLVPPARRLQPLLAQ